MFAPHPFSYKSVAGTFLLLWMSVFLSADLFAGSFRTYPIRCLMQSSSGDIWLATDGEGLIRVSPDGKEAHAYTVDDRLASNSINSLLEDNEGRIWFSTEKELYCLDCSRDMIISANDFLDVSWGYYNPNAALKLKNGCLAFGTAEGVLSFLPSLDLGAQVSVELILTDFKPASYQIRVYHLVVCLCLPVCTV